MKYIRPETKKKQQAVLDNTRVTTGFLPTRLTARQKQSIRLKELSEAAEKNQARIYDTDKAKYHLNLQNFYNTNFFGAGLSGNQSRHDYTTLKGLEAIQSDIDYAKGTLSNFGTAYLTTGIGGIFRGILPLVSRRATIGKLLHLMPYKIGEGAEAIVINNSPTTVGKIALMETGEMLRRNAIPNALPNKFVGYVKYGTNKFPTFVLKKVKILTDKTFPKYVGKLDKAMQKSGFRRVYDPDVQYRAYTNGLVVVDDIAPGNVGVDWFGRPKMVDFNLLTVPEWIELGFSLKKGGKLNATKA